MDSKWKMALCTCTCRLDSSVVGGESVFLDGYYVAEELREKYPLEFEVLTTTPIRLKNRMLYDKLVELMYLNELIFNHYCFGIVD